MNCDRNLPNRKQAQIENLVRHQSSFIWVGFCSGRKKLYFKYFNIYNSNSKYLQLKLQLREYANNSDHSVKFTLFMIIIDYMPISYNNKMLLKILIFVYKSNVVLHHATRIFPDYIRIQITKDLISLNVPRRPKKKL